MYSIMIYAGLALRFLIHGANFKVFPFHSYNFLIHIPKLSVVNECQANKIIANKLAFDKNWPSIRIHQNAVKVKLTLT